MHEEEYIPHFEKANGGGKGGSREEEKLRFPPNLFSSPPSLPRFALITTGFSYLGNGGFCCWESFSPRGVESKNFFFFFHPFNLYGPLDRERERERGKEKGERKCRESFFSPASIRLCRRHAEGCFVDFFCCLPSAHPFHVYF